MGALRLDELLTKMDAIADAVNKFSSESVQQLAFTALMQSAGVTTATNVGNRKSDDDMAKGEGDEPVKQPKGSSGKRSKAVKKVITPAKDIDLRPQGKMSFRDFVAEKQPTNNDERNVVAVHYLIDVIEMQSIGLPQILACYRDATWKLPSDIANALQITASAKGWVDSSDSSNILLTSSGRNTVEFDLPKAK